MSADHGHFLVVEHDESSKEYAARRMSLAGWTAALAELETIAVAAEQSGTLADWEPSPELGPLPGELAPQARRVLALQRSVRERLEADRERIAAQLRASARAQQRQSAVSVFVDVEG